MVVFVVFSTTTLNFVKSRPNTFKALRELSTFETTSSCVRISMSFMNFRQAFVISELFMIFSSLASSFAIWFACLTNNIVRERLYISVLVFPRISMAVTNCVVSKSLTDNCLIPSSVFNMEAKFEATVCACFVIAAQVVKSSFANL